MIYLAKAVANYTLRWTGLIELVSFVSTPVTYFRRFIILLLCCCCYLVDVFYVPQERNVSLSFFYASAYQ